MTPNPVTIWRQIRKQRRFLEKIAALAIGAIVAVAAVLAAGLLLRHLNQQHPQSARDCHAVRPTCKYASPADYERNYHVRPTAAVRCVKSNEGETAWDVTLGYDGFGRRLTLPEPSGPVKKFAMFYGCSFMFGEGVDDPYTLPSQFAAAAQKCHVYNYGKGGASPHDMLYELQTRKYEEEIAEREGVLVYDFLMWDVYQVGLSRGGSQHVYYRLKPDGTLDTRPRPQAAVSKLEGWLRGEVRGERRRSRAELQKLTGEIIVEAAREFRRRFNSPWFVVVFYPFYYPYNDETDAQPMLDFLRQQGVICLDYRRLFDQPTNTEYVVHRFDFHPSPLAHCITAEHLVDDLREMGAID